MSGFVDFDDDVLPPKKNEVQCKKRWSTNYWKNCFVVMKKGVFMICFFVCLGTYVIIYVIEREFEMFYGKFKDFGIFEEIWNI